MKILNPNLQPITRKLEDTLVRRTIGRHQGKKEIERRLRQLKAGILKATP